MEKKTPNSERRCLPHYMAERKELFRLLYDHEASWRKLQYKIQMRRMHRWGIYTVATAAVFLLILGLNHRFFSDTNIFDQKNVETVVVSFPETGNRKAVLTLDSGEKIDLSVHKDTLSVTKSVLINNKEQDLLVYTQMDVKAMVSQTNILTVPRGGEYQLQLSDGTKVWMNAESSLTYPVVFSGKIREVFLCGEAFFEVAKDKSQPFVVRTDRHSVEVLGTSFNVSAYPDYHIYTTIAEGKVKVETSVASVVLTADHQAVIGLESDDIVTRSVDASLFTSWANGCYEFRNTSLEEIAAQLSRWYNVDICFRSEALKRKRFAGIIFRHEELNMAIEIIEEVSDVHFTRADGKIYIENIPK